MGWRQRFSTYVRQADIINGVTGEPYSVEIVVDTNGIGKDLHLEQVVFRTEDGVEKFVTREDFKVVRKKAL